MIQETQIARITSAALNRVMTGEMPDTAWINALKESYPPEKLGAQLKHTCPKWAFRILCHKGYVKGATGGSCPRAEGRSSAAYTLKARDLLIGERSLVMDKRELTRRTFGEKDSLNFRRPNQEIDVLLSLVASGALVL